jgi:hypothetical protein
MRLNVSQLNLVMSAREKGMTEDIDEIIDRTIEYTCDILSNNTVHWLTAREGLEKILITLQIGTPDHPGIRRLRRYIAELNLIYGDDETLH